MSTPSIFPPMPPPEPRPRHDDGVCLTHDERVRFNELARRIFEVEAQSPSVVLDIPDPVAPQRSSWWRRRWRRARGMPDVW
jgi:hypothetical protein